MNALSALTMFQELVFRPTKIFAIINIYTHLSLLITFDAQHSIRGKYCPTHPRNALYSICTEVGFADRYPKSGIILCKPSLQSFHQAIEAFYTGRWYMDIVGTKHENIPLPLPNEWHCRPRKLLEPPAFKFISTCPTIGLRGISEENRICPVCTNAYVPRSANADLTVNLDTTVARILPCKHIICSNCLQK